MKALIIVDLQNDFLPGGSLAVPDGDQIIPLVNALQDRFDCIVASKDWHPEGHISFKEWPPHCIQNTKGAEFPQNLRTSKIEKVFLKGDDPQKDSYTSFDQMEPYLKKRGVDEVVIVGLALDVCVKETAIMAAEKGWRVTVLPQATRALKKKAEVLKELEKLGVKIGQV